MSAHVRGSQVALQAPIDRQDRVRNLVESAAKKLRPSRRGFAPVVVAGVSSVPRAANEALLPRRHLQRALI